MSWFSTEKMLWLSFHAPDKTSHKMLKIVKEIYVKVWQIVSELFSPDFGGNNVNAQHCLVDTYKLMRESYPFGLFEKHIVWSCFIYHPIHFFVHHVKSGWCFSHQNLELSSGLLSMEKKEHIMFFNKNRLTVQDCFALPQLSSNAREGSTQEHKRARVMWWPCDVTSHRWI